MDSPLKRAIETAAPGTRSEAKKKGRHETGALLDNDPLLAARGSENAAIAGESDALLLNADKYSYLLLARFLAVNLAAAMLFAGAWTLGWPQRAIEADASRLTWVIAAVFVAGWFLCLWRLAKIAFELNCAHRGACHVLNHYRSVVAARGAATARRALELRLFGRIAAVRHVANTLVLLGLIGTVVGFIHAFSGITGEVVGDTGKASEVITAAMNGMAIALYTTLVGTVGHVWLMTCYRMLETGAANLAALVFET